MQDFSIDVLNVQEARISKNSFPATRQWARRLRYSAFISEVGLDDDGRVTAECLTLSRLPMQALTNPDTHLAHRCLVTAFKPPGRDLVVNVNVRGMHNAHENYDLYDAIFRRKAVTGRQYVVLGDHNMVPTEGAVGEAIAKGIEYVPETPEEQERSTRPLQEYGRHIDYGLFHRGLVPFRRDQGTVKGMADHDLVFYDFNVGEDIASFNFATRPTITRTTLVTSDEYCEAFLDREQAFDEAEACGDSNAMWAIATGKAEGLLTEPDAGGVPRHRPPRVNQPAPDGQQPEKASTRLQRLQRLHRLAYDVAHNPLDTEKMLEISRTQAIAARKFPDLRYKL